MILNNINESSYEPLKYQEAYKLLNLPDNKPLVNTKATGIVSGFCASSFINDQYSNIDKITIATNLKLSSHAEGFKFNLIYDLPLINLFAIFDAHNGKKTAERLRDKLYKLIIYDEDFLIRTSQSILNALVKIEEEIKMDYINGIETDDSGASVILCMTINNFCYIVSLGGCRAVLSYNFGGKVFRLNNDSKNLNKSFNSNEEKRSSSSYLNVIGNIKAKLAETKLNNTKNANIIANTITNNSIPPSPEIFSFKLSTNEDFLILLSDSIMEKLSNFKIAFIMYESLYQAIETSLNIEALYYTCIQKILKAAIENNARGNLTCVILFFQNFLELHKTEKLDLIKSKLNYLNQINCDVFYNIKANITDRIGIYFDVELINDSLANINNSNPDEKKEEIISQFTGNNNTTSKNLVINNINNNINITKATKIYCCCFKRKKKKNLENMFKGVG